MANQVLGLFEEPRLALPSTMPASVDQVLAGNASQPLLPQGGGGPVMPGAQPQQVAGLFGQGARGAAAGIGAAGQVGPSYDATSAAVNIGTATASGAASGAMVGGPVGAAGGGGIGLATPSIQAWMQVEAENKRKAETEKLIREIEEKQAARDKRDRQDSLSQLRYNRKQAAFEKAWGIAAAQRDAITSLINQNTTLRSRYIKTGIRSAYA